MSRRGRILFWVLAPFLFCFLRLVILLPTLFLTAILSAESGPPPRWAEGFAVLNNIAAYLLSGYAVWRVYLEFDKRPVLENPSIPDRLGEE